MKMPRMPMLGITALFLLGFLPGNSEARMADDGEINPPETEEFPNIGPASDETGVVPATSFEMVPDGRVIAGMHRKVTWPGAVSSPPVTLIQSTLELRSNLDFSPSAAGGILANPIRFHPVQYFREGIPMHLSRETLWRFGADPIDSRNLWVFQADNSFTGFRGRRMEGTGNAQARLGLDFLEAGVFQGRTKDEWPYQVTGDGKYILSSIIYVRRENTWHPDTAGLSGTPTCLTMDTARIPYLATSAGLFRRRPDPSGWEKVAGFPSTSARSIFIDRANRFYASTPFGIFRSLDGGASFHLHAADLEPLGFGDDAYGNIFAHKVSNQVFRSKGGTAAWEKVGMELENLADGQFDHNILGVQGDTSLMLFTSVGIYVSTDQGSTFRRNAVWFRAATSPSIKEGRDGSVYASNSLGIYRRKPAEKTWSRIFPDSGFVGNRAIFEDTSGKLFTLGRRGSNGYPLPMVKSQLSSPWVHDTSGLSVLPLFTNPVNREEEYYFVDPAGHQHLADHWGLRDLRRVYVKRPGESWAFDTTGIPLNLGPSTKPFAWGADKAGNRFLSLGGQVSMVFIQAAGGTWGSDTNGLGPTRVLAFALGKEGRLWAGGYGRKGSLFYREGGGWQRAPIPKDLSEGSAAYALAVDGDGTVFAAFRDTSGPWTSTHGVWSTSDDGKSWIPIGMRKVQTRALFHAGSRIYATTYGEGVFVLNKSKPAKISNRGLSPVGPAMSLQGSHFSGTRTLELVLPTGGRVRAEVLTVRGVVLRQVADQVLPVGRQTLRLDVGFLSGGVYLLKIEAFGIPGKRVLGFIR